MNRDKAIEFFEICLKELSTCTRSYTPEHHNYIRYNGKMFTGLCKFIYDVAEKYKYTYTEAIGFDNIMHLFLTRIQKQKLVESIASKDRYDLYGVIESRKDFLNDLVRKLQKIC